MATFRTSRTFDAVFLICLGAIVAISAVNRVAIGDWMYFASHTPSSQVAQIASDAGLSEYGRRLLYRTNPQFVSQAALDAECDIERLGCLNPRGQSFILYSPANQDQTVVTAVHEMLHLAYRRLSQAQKDELAPLLDQAMANNATALSDELRSSENVEDRRDEAHSLLGTEYQKLPSELETYYQTYFTDRSKVVKAAASE